MAAKSRRPFSARRNRYRPESALVLAGNGRHAFVDEFLQPFSFPCLGCVQIALGIDRDAMHAIELSGLPATVTECRQFLQRLTINDMDFVVHSVRQENVFLLRIFRERDIPDRADALVFLAKKASLTNFPSGVNTCSRSPARSQTYIRRSTDMPTQCTGLRNCCAGFAGS